MNSFEKEENDFVMRRPSEIETKMKRLYKVTTQEIHHSVWEVEATSERDALNEVFDSAGDLKTTEYYETVDDPDTVHIERLED